MKRIIFIGFLLSLSGIALCQAPLDKAQKKRVAEINKQVQKQHNDILKSTISVDEKKSRVEETRRERDAELAKVLSFEQVTAVTAKDPVDWSKMISKIDKQEKARLKSERDQKLKEVDQQLRDVGSQQDDVSKQMKDLKRKQKDLSEQQKALKKQKKEINAFYK